MPTTPPTITPLPTPPDPNDRSTFNTRAYPWSVAQQTLATEVAAVAANVKGNADEAVASALSASTAQGGAENARDAAMGYAASALNAPGTQATSTSSVSVTTGTKNIVIQTGKAFSIGQRGVLARTSNPATCLFVRIDAHNSGTGALQLEALTVEGSGGPFTDWTFSLSSPGATAAPEQKTRSITSADTAVSGDRQKVLVFTGTSALSLAFDPVATLTDGWFVKVQNASTFAWTLDPSGSEQIDGAASLVLQPGEVREVRCTGSALATLKVYDNNILIVRDEKTSGTNGGSSSATTWNARALNTTVLNTIAGASLVSDQITLPAGTYLVDASAPARVSNGHQLRLYNVTGSTVLLTGTSEFAPSADTTITRSLLRGSITLASSATLRLDHYTSAAVANTGLGAPVSSGTTEVYAEVMIRKVA